MKRDLEVVTAQAQSPKWGVASIGVMTRMWATCRPYALDRPIGRLCEERTFIRDDVNDRNWVDSCRFRLADRAAVPRTAQAIHSANGQWLTYCVPLNRQNPIQIFKAQPAGGSVLGKCL